MTTPPPAAAAALDTEAKELQADITETKTEAAAARTAGDDARADRLEANIAKTQADLDEVKTMLKALTDRPFHPAPGDGEAPAPGDGENKPGNGEAPAEEPKTDKPKGRPNRFFGDRWNQD
jgi:hypothetical protein